MIPSNLNGYLPDIRTDYFLIFEVVPAHSFVTDSVVSLYKKIVDGVDICYEIKFGVLRSGAALNNHIDQRFRSSTGHSES